MISTYAVDRVPWAWIAQSRPGGRIVTPWGRLGHVALTVAADGQSASEDLSGIRQRVTAKKDQRARPHSWAFAQLGAFVAYKAQRVGVPVIQVDPKNTSRQCSECWHTHRTNRVRQAKFVCRACGTTLHADLNGSRDIAYRADAVWQRGAVNRPRTA